jgi:murein DD-endopeptidase MepM/ murein hydrolase activator NlpD
MSITITSIADLEKIGHDVLYPLSGSYVLGADLDASGVANFNPIGSSSNPFTGTFDGAGHTISNLTINGGTSIYVGLFRYVDTSGVISNLGLINLTVTAPDGYDVGGMVGRNLGHIINSYTTGSVTGTAGDIVSGLTGVAVGGLVGWNFGTIDQSYSAATVTSPSTQGVVLGGLAGGNTGTIDTSSADGVVTGHSGSYGSSLVAIGGLVGELGFGNSNSGAIINSFAGGAVVGTGSDIAVGGLVGIEKNSSTITTSNASGNVSAESPGWVGGLVGVLFNGAISQSAAFGAATVGDLGDAGGLVGQMSAGTIFQSYATGSATAGNSADAGGLIGHAYGGTITQTHATGQVSVGHFGFAGELIGENGGATVTASYSNIELPFMFTHPVTQGPNTGSSGGDHKGFMVWSYDFAMPAGTAVLSVGSGRVVDARDYVPDGTNTDTLKHPDASDGSGGFGNYVTILLDDGTYVTYMHLASGTGVSVHIGQHVDAETVLGVTGYTGIRTGPHLHVEFGTTQYHSGEIAADPAAVTHGVQNIIANGASDSTPPIDFNELTTLLASHHLLDGYLAGATVFVDANDNGIFDAGELSATTDSNGGFTLVSGDGPLIAQGGTDTSTGLQFNGKLSAPSGYSVITPLTTLIDDLQSQGVTAAEQKVLAAFDLSSNLDLTIVDPIAAARAGDAAGAAAYLAGAKVYDSVSLVASALAGSGGSFAAAAHDTFATLASAINGSGLNLTDQPAVSALISNIAQSENLTLAPGVADSVASIIVASNAALDQKALTDGSGDPLLSDVAAIELVAQAGASNAIQQAGNDLDQLHVIVDAFTGANLDNFIATGLNQLAAGQDTAPPVLTPVADQTDEAASAAGAVALFSATATDLSDGTDSVVFKEGSTVVHAGDTFSLGTHTITTSAMDVAGNTASETFTIRVVDTTAPELAAIGDRSVHATSLAGAAVTFAATASDLVDGNDPIVFMDGNTLVHSGDTFSLGAHTIAVSATDVAGNMASEHFTINVLDAAPVVSALARNVGEDGPIFSQALLAGASDADPGDLLSVAGLDASVTTTGGRTLVRGTDYTLVGSVLALTTAGFAEFNNLAALQTDQAVFHFDVSDGILGTANTLTLTVVGANDAPILANQTASQSASAGTPFLLALPANTFQDPDSGDHLALAATLGNGSALPSWLTFNTTTATFSGTPGSGNAGNLDIKVTATDPGGLAATDTFHLSVTNHAPVITSDAGGTTASIIITDDSKYVATVHATDPDPNTTLKYSIAGGADQKLFTIDSSTGVLSFKSMPQDGHSYQVTVAASDGNLQDTQAIKVQVANGVSETGNPNVADTFVFKPDFKLAIVSNFDAASANHDVLELDHTLFRQADVHSSPAAIFDLIENHSFQFGRDVLIVTDAHDVIDLKNTSLHSLTAQDFLLA